MTCRDCGGKLAPVEGEHRRTYGCVKCGLLQNADASIRKALGRPNRRKKKGVRSEEGRH